MLEVALLIAMVLVEIASKVFQLNWAEIKRRIYDTATKQFIKIGWLKTTRFLFAILLVAFLSVDWSSFASGYLLFVGRTRRMTQCLTPTARGYGAVFLL